MDSKADCPPREELSAFLQGQLPSERRETLADHLTHCGPCESSMRDLQSEDIFLRRLRRPPVEGTVLEEPACWELEQRALAIPSDELATATVSAHGEYGQPSGPPLPAVFASYLLMNQIGHGGMGLVYEALQEPLKRPVALKLVRAGVYASADERMRFLREGKVIARIDHRHVVRIHEFGEHQGQLYFSMELLKGGALADRLKKGSLPEREAAELVRTLAQAVQAAHGLGIVHRDLKPSNVLFAEDGTVKITDFGLAKVLDDDSSETCSEAILGTPAYMAPEQARGESRQIGYAADVYALGVILYEALTGRPPIRGITRSETLEWVRTREPEPPSRQRRGLSRDLEAICLRCLEKDSSRRYPSAQALADDLERWLQGEPTVAQPLKGLRRFGWFLHRHSRSVGVAVLLLCLTIAIPATLWYRDPDRSIKSIEGDLARGKARSLIGKLGPPLWSRLVTGKESSQFASATDKDFTVHARSLCLLELLPDPHWDHYWVHTEVRHDDGEESSEVGLFVGYHVLASDEGLMDAFVQLTFNDVVDETAARMAIPGIPQVPARPKANLVRLIPHLYQEGEQGRDTHHRLGGTSRRLFQPAGWAGGVWRPLNLEVFPDKVRASWGIETIGEIPLGEFPARAPLGIYVFRSSASFRNFVVEPVVHTP